MANDEKATLVYLNRKTLTSIAKVSGKKGRRYFLTVNSVVFASVDEKM